MMLVLLRGSRLTLMSLPLSLMLVSRVVVIVFVVVVVEVVLNPDASSTLVTLVLLSLTPRSDMMAVPALLPSPTGVRLRQSPPSETVGLYHVSTLRVSGSLHTPRVGEH